MDSGERGMNPVAMIIINPRKEYWRSHGSNQRPVLSPQRYHLSYGTQLMKNVNEMRTVCKARTQEITLQLHCNLYSETAQGK